MEARTQDLTRLWLGLFILSALAFSAVSALGQDNNTQTPPVSANKEYVGPSADSIRPYKPAGRDPFKRTIKPPKDPKKSGPKTDPLVQLGFPSLEVRRAQYRQLVDKERNQGRPDPHPLRQYLVGELTVTGVYRDDQGFGAFVKAQPTGTMFFIRRGEQCYNGEVLRIEGDDSDAGAAKVLFRESTHVEVNGKQSTQVRVVAKLPAAPGRK
jgi:hypothetical protein